MKITNGCAHLLEKSRSPAVEGDLQGEKRARLTLLLCLPGHSSALSGSFGASAYSATERLTREIVRRVYTVHIHSSLSPTPSLSSYSSASSPPSTTNDSPPRLLACACPPERESQRFINFAFGGRRREVG